MNFRISLTIMVLFLIFGGGISSESNIPDKPLILFTQSPLSVTRDQEKLFLDNNSTLHTGDIIETGSNQFAVILFPPDASVIIHPVSRIELKSLSTLQLYSADIQIDTGNSISAIPDSIRCFDTLVTPLDSRQTPSSFMMQCRGQSGIILASFKGAQRLQSRNNSYFVSAGEALMGRATSSGYMETPLPDRPVLSITTGVDKLLPAESSPKHYLYWEPVPMADQYLIHISGFDSVSETTVHRLAFQRKQLVNIENLPPGSYQIRVAALDYYGVMSNWSQVYSLELN